MASKIDEGYKKAFGTDMKDDIRKANQKTIDERNKKIEAARKAAKEAEEAAAKTSDLE